MSLKREVFAWGLIDNPMQIISTRIVMMDLLDKQEIKGITGTESKHLAGCFRSEGINKQLFTGNLCNSYLDMLCNHHKK